MGSTEFYMNIVQSMFGGAMGGGEGMQRIGPDPKDEAARDRRLMAWLALANDAVQQLDTSYRPPVFPERPAEVPTNDYEVLASLRVVSSAAKRGKKAPEHDRAVAKRFGEWKADIVQREAKSQAALASVANYHDVYSAIEERGGGDDSITERKRQLEVHARYHWDVQLPLAKERQDRQRQVLKACRRSDIMPSWLLNGTEPPKYVPPRANEDEFDDDD